MLACLVVVKDPDTAKPLAAVLEKRGLEVTQARDGAIALDLLQERSFDLILAESELPKVGGRDLLKRVQLKHPETRLVLLSRDTSSRAAVEAIRAGAFDYLTLPTEDKDLWACLGRALGTQESGPTAGRALGQPGAYSEIIGQSDPMLELFRMIDKLAATDSTVMITGESGTGKELVARAIHRNGRRGAQPLIPVNCGAIPEDLLESELFGHEKGAFTNAVRSRPGRFELANQGTIFLDEVADMSPKLQVRLLRVLQERQLERVGSTQTLNIDIRVITASNRDLYQAMQEGWFREDLYYRLNVVPIHIPPLRERRADIPLLVDHFRLKFNSHRDKEIQEVDPEVMDLFIGYAWPGNVRELENVIERMAILTDTDQLTVKDVPAFMLPSASRSGPRGPEIPEEGLDFNQVVSDFEDHLLLQALEKSGWVKNKAARLLNLNRTTLVEKLKKKNISPAA